MNIGVRKIIFFLLGSWSLEVVLFSLNFFDRNISDLMVTSSLLALGFAAGRLLGKTGFRWVPALRITLALLVISFALPLSYWLNSFSAYSALPIRFSSLLLGLMIYDDEPFDRWDAVGFLTGLATAAFLPFHQLCVLLTTSLLLFVAGLKKIQLVVVLLVCFILLFVPGKDYTYYPDQVRYYDNLVFSKHTGFQQVDVTAWKGELWFYMNNRTQFSSFDHALYYEPFIHPAAMLCDTLQKVLVVGGENGLAVRELLKYSSINEIMIHPIDPGLAKLASADDHFLHLNDSSLLNDKVKFMSGNIMDRLYEEVGKYDLIVADIPDPVDVETNQYYTRDFYELALGALRPEGLMVTQSLSPYLSPLSYQMVQNTLHSTGSTIVPLHNQVPTLGEWSWTLVSPTMERDLKGDLTEIRVSVPTRWLNEESLHLITNFGKNTQPDQPVNTLENPVLYQDLLREAVYR